MYVLILAICALLLSLWLLRASAASKGLPGCGAGSACDAVTHSRWARWGPFPVALGGTIIYLLVAIAAFLASSTFNVAARRASELALLGLAPLLVGAAIWFMAIQWLVIGRTCIYCTAIHVLALAVVALLLVDANRILADNRPRGITPWMLMLPGSIALAGLIGGQILLKPRQYKVTLSDVRKTSTGPPDGPAADFNKAPVPAPAGAPNPFMGRKVSVLAGQIVIPADAGPVMGADQATHIFVFLFDYTCDVCHHVHRLIEQAVARYPQQLAVLLLPVPADPTCNPLVTQKWRGHADACAYARLALAVWLADRTKFAAIDQYLCLGDDPPPLVEAIARAKEMVDLRGLDPRIADAELEPIIRLGIRTLEQSGVEKTPVLLMPTGTLEGRPQSLKELCAVLEAQMATATER